VTVVISTNALRCLLNNSNVRSVTTTSSTDLSSVAVEIDYVLRASPPSPSKSMYNGYQK